VEVPQQKRRAVSLRSAHVRDTHAAAVVFAAARAYSSALKDVHQWCVYAACRGARRRGAMAAACRAAGAQPHALYRLRAYAGVQQAAR